LDRAETRFETQHPVAVPNRQMTAVPLVPTDGGSQHVEVSQDGGVTFRTRGWFEVLLKVAWSRASDDGHRFSHTKIPGQEPLHSEAIEADVLAQLSSGEQLLRGNSLFGPGWAEQLVLEVWQDSGHTLDVEQAEITVRDLGVPWPPTA
jgi:hypothetical protein